MSSYWQEVALEIDPRRQDEAIDRISLDDPAADLLRAALAEARCERLFTRENK
jgi:hypothetical protein